MKINRWVISSICLLMLATLACDTTDESAYPDAPASASGTTDSEGLAELDLGSHIITVKVVDFIPQPISNIDVTVHLLKDYLYVFAVGNDQFYSNHKLVSYSDLEADGGMVFAPKPALPQTFETTVEITLERITRDVYSYAEEPQYQDSIPGDDWITPVSYEGSITDVYNLADSLAVEKNIIIHITDNVASLTNTNIKTIAMIMDSTTIISDTVFSVLLGLEFHVFNADTLTISYFEYGDSILPVIFLSDIGLAEGSFFAQFTLTWGEVPEDLDSHLWTPVIGASSYHIYYVNKGTIADAPYCFLDVDDVTSWGPEHVIIQESFPGTYYYSVYHYAGESDIPNSGAKVSLLKPDRSVEEFTPPNVVDSGEGWYWHVCTIDGTTGEITEIGTMSLDPPTPAESAGPMPSKAY